MTSPVGSSHHRLHEGHVGTEACAPGGATIIAWQRAYRSTRDFQMPSDSATCRVPLTACTNSCAGQKVSSQPLPLVVVWPALSGGTLHTIKHDAAVARHARWGVLPPSCCWTNPPGAGKPAPFLSRSEQSRLVDGSLDAAVRL